MRLGVRVAAVLMAFLSLTGCQERTPATDPGPSPTPSERSQPGPQNLEPGNKPSPSFNLQGAKQPADQTVSEADGTLLLADIESGARSVVARLVDPVAEVTPSPRGTHAFVTRNRGANGESCLLEPYLIDLSSGSEQKLSDPYDSYGPGALAPAWEANGNSLFFNGGRYRLDSHRFEALLPQQEGGSWAGWDVAADGIRVAGLWVDAGTHRLSLSILESGHVKTSFENVGPARTADGLIPEHRVQWLPEKGSLLFEALDSQFHPAILKADIQQRQVALWATGAILVSVAPTGNQILIRRLDGSGQVLSPDGAILWDLAAAPHPDPRETHWSSNGERLAVTGASDGATLVYDAATGRQLLRLQHATALGWGPDGRKVYVLSGSPNRFC